MTVFRRVWNSFVWYVAVATHTLSSSQTCVENEKTKKENWHFSWNFASTTLKSQFWFKSQVKDSVRCFFLLFSLNCIDSRQTGLNAPYCHLLAVKVPPIFTLDSPPSHLWGRTSARRLLYASLWWVMFFFFLLEGNLKPLLPRLNCLKIRKSISVPNYQGVGLYDHIYSIYAFHFTGTGYPH